MNKIKGKTILITGGTGSFGNVVVRRLIPLQPKKIIIFSRDELKQELMRNEYDNPLLHFIIGDIRDEKSIELATRGVDYIFHAAALKQVPACEIYPMEAIKTNVLGASNVINAAIKNKVKRMVILSTDKAVYPINVMGMTKALMEKLMVAASKSQSDTIFCGVRYGNVLYSRGSVVPYFVSSIKLGKALRLTDPRMTRFLLTLDQAVDLVLTTLETGENGKMYIMRAPACTVETLAQAVCEIFGYPKKLEIIGRKTGEKIHEILEGEEGEEPFTSENTKRLNVEETKKLLLTLPEIRSILNETKP